MKVRFVTNQDFDGEDENDVNKVMRSLPEDTNQLVSNYLKDVFVSLLEVVFILFQVSVCSYLRNHCCLASHTTDRRQNMEGIACFGIVGLLATSPVLLPM